MPARRLGRHFPVFHPKQVDRDTAVRARRLTLLRNRQVSSSRVKSNSAVGISSTVCVIADLLFPTPLSNEAPRAGGDVEQRATAPHRGVFFASAFAAAFTCFTASRSRVLPG